MGAGAASDADAGDGSAADLDVPDDMAAGEWNESCYCRERLKMLCCVSALRNGLCEHGAVEKRAVEWS